MRALGGRYRLETPLGTGGMAVVWRARDLVLCRQVAVKLLAPRVAGRLSRARIRAEAQVAAGLAHPNIASVYDYGESRRGPRTRVPYIVMELVDGDTLASRMRDARMHWRTAVRIVAEVAAALSAAHASGVVHCDVKPANVMLARTGVKVVDFGIAAAAGSIKDDGELFGTPAYIAPERIRGAAPVPASDVYALGVLLSQCLTGSLPWPATTVTELIRAHRHVDPAPLPPIDGLPPEVAELYEQCLSKSPDERPTSLYAAAVLAEAAGVAVALPPVSADGEPARPNPPTVVIDPRLGGPYDGGTVPVAAASGPAAPGSPSGRRVAGVALVTGVVAATAAAVVAFALSSDPPAGAPQAGAATPAGPRCAARYVAEHRPGGAFTAEVAITNTGPDRRGGWSVAFAMPAGQRVTDARGVRWDQRGDSVTLRGEAPLAAGDTVRLALSGTSGPAAAAPTGFTLDGAACVSSTSDVRDAQPDGAAPDARTDNSGPGNADDPARRAGGSGSGSGSGSGGGGSGSGGSGAGSGGSGGVGAGGGGAPPGNPPPPPPRPEPDPESGLCLPLLPCLPLG